MIAKEIVWNNLVLIQHDALMRTARQSSLGVHVVYTVGSAREHARREWDVWVRESRLSNRVLSGVTRWIVLRNEIAALFAFGTCTCARMCVCVCVCVWIYTWS